MTETASQTPYRQAADLYWAAGWHGVLPLPAAAKKNPPTGYTGSAGRYPSYPDIMAWIEDHAGGNIALRMPPNVIGLDVDAYGDKPGDKTLALAESMHGPLPPTWRTTSRDDGVSGIRLYRVPEALAWPGEIGAATEIIQRNHRYALVWPSLHPEGRTYRWIGPDGVTSTRIPDPDQLPALPDTWVQAYTGGITATTVTRNNVRHDEALAWIATQPHATATPCTRMTTVIEGARHDIGNGSAHNPARDYSLRIVRLTEEHHRGGITALGVARDAFMREACNPERVLLGKTRRTEEEAAYEWGDLVASAVGLVTANPTGMSTCDCDGQLTGAVLEQQPTTPDTTEQPPEPTPVAVETVDPLNPLREKLKDGEEFILNVPEHIPTIWGDQSDALWVEGEALMLAGPPGVGKTTLTGQVLRGLLGLQDRVLDLPITPANKILYLAMDRPAQIRRALSRAFTRTEAPTLRERIEFWEGPPPGDFAKHPDVLLTLAQLAGATHVIIDSLKDAAIGLSEDDTGAAYNRARQKALAGGVQLLELHHMVKRGAGGNKPTELADVYGSAWLTAGAGSVVLLWGAAGDPIVELKHLKQPVGEVGPYKLQHDHDTGTTRIFHGTDILAIVAGSGSTGVTAKAIACQMFETDKPTRAEHEKARRRLERLVREGIAEAVTDDSNPFSGGTPATTYRLTQSSHETSHAQSRPTYPQAVTGPVTTPVTAVTPNTVSAGQSSHGQSRPTNTPRAVTFPPPLKGGRNTAPAPSGLKYAACNTCGEEFLATAIQRGHGHCTDCQDR